MYIVSVFTYTCVCYSPFFDCFVLLQEQCEDKQELADFVNSVEEVVRSLTAVIEERASMLN